MAKPNIVAIVQARLGSTRLPLKSLVNLRGTPVIDWVTQRISRSEMLDDIIVALPDTKLDQALASHLEHKNVNWMAGSENDVLKRFCQAARLTNADLIVRVCADNPLVWWEAIDRLINFYLNAEADYAYNHIPLDNLWPDGLGAEIISGELLERLDSSAKSPAQREHCLNYIHDNPEKFKIATFNPAEPWLARPDLKLDLDTVADYENLALKNITPASNAREIISAFH